MAKKAVTSEAIAVSCALLAVLAFLPVLNGESQSADVFSRDAVAESVYTEEDDEEYAFAQAILDFEVRDIIEGTGHEAQTGDTVYVHYVGQLPNGERFDTSTDGDAPFAVVLGSGQVITGWELGLIGMREGGTRRLIVPPELAYGEQEITDITGKVRIPANATLYFDIVLLHVEQ